MGKKKALIALAHTMLRIAYHILKKKSPYQELGADYLEKKRKQVSERREQEMIKQLEAKGYTVSQTA
jgi:transposase